VLIFLLRFTLTCVHGPCRSTTVGSVFTSMRCHAFVGGFSSSWILYSAPQPLGEELRLPARISHHESTSVSLLAFVTLNSRWICGMPGPVGLVAPALA
jgi:hypothetical protein